MILSNLSIQKMIDTGALVIDPEPQPRRRPPGGGTCPYQTSAVDLRLGNELSWLEEGLPITIDLRKGGFKKLADAGSVDRKIDDGDCYTLQPGHFILGRTLERVGFPIREEGPWLAGRVEGRSSYARCGLVVHFTAPTVHAGFEGTITLEMMNFGQYPISLYPNTPICQLIVEMLDSKPFRNDSQFQGQSDPSGRSPGGAA